MVEDAGVQGDGLGRLEEVIRVVLVCAKCWKPPAMCRCPPPQELIAQDRIRQAADMLAMRYERHNLTEQDVKFLKAIRASWV